MLLVPEDQKDYEQHLLMTFKVDDPAKRQAFQEAIATFVNNDSQAEENKVGTRRSKDKKDRHKILQEAMVKIFEN